MFKKRKYKKTKTPDIQRELKKYEKTKTKCRLCGRIITYFATDKDDIRDVCLLNEQRCYKKGQKPKEKKQKEIARCQGCDKLFEKTQKKQIYCSSSCRPVGIRLDGKPIQVKKKKWVGEIRECKTCGSAFKATKIRSVYCSTYCAPKGFRLNGERRKGIVLIDMEKFQRVERAKGAAAQRWNLWRETNNDPKYLNAKYPICWRDIAETIRRRDVYTCMLCSTGLSWIHQGKLLGAGHIHHIDEDKGNNTPENLVMLCRKCHLDVVHKYHRSKWLSGRSGRSVKEWRTLWLKNLSYWISYFEILMNQPDMKTKNNAIRKAILDLL